MSVCMETADICEELVPALWNQPLVIGSLDIKRIEGDVSAHIHFRGGGFRSPHPGAVLQTLAEVLVDLDPRVWRRAYKEGSES